MTRKKERILNIDLYKNMQLWESIALIKSFTAHLIERIEKNTVPTLDIKKEDQNTIERLALYFGGCLK